MKIIMPTIWFHRGQTEVTKTLRRVLEELGHEVIIHARMGGVFGEDNKQEKNRYGWDLGKTFYWNEYDLKKTRFIDYLDETKPDLILMNEEYDWDLIKRLKDKRFKVATYLDYLHKDWLKFPSPLDLYDLILCSTKRAYEMIEPVIKEKAKYIGWGMSEENRIYYPWKYRPYLFFENIGWLGINDRKGLGVLLYAYQKFLSKYQECFGSLLIHSQISISLIASARLKGIDVMIGSMNLPGLYHMSQIYCYPARLDGLGLSMLEAMVNGLIVICPDYPPWNEFIENNVNGILIPIVSEREREDGIAFKEVLVDPNKFAQAMEELYLDHVVRNGIAEKVGKTAYKKLGWEVFKSRIETALELVK